MRDPIEFTTVRGLTKWAQNSGVLVTGAPTERNPNL